MVEWLIDNDGRERDYVKDMVTVLEALHRRSGWPTAHIYYYGGTGVTVSV